MSSPPKVTVKQGRIVGGTDALPNGNPYYFFKGIPYAEPPLGKLRFKAPVALKTFALPEIECTKEGNISFQPAKNGSFIGSEDCLFLNVYTPKINSEQRLPVMVYIPGGAFRTGSGNSEMYNPVHLIQEDVVVVTMNYRLGILGFVSLPEGNISGNAGLKDQKLVLEWVQENISQFGGDKNNVTLFGQSAGSFSACVHLLSETSRKLFHRAILQSGSANMSFLIEDNISYKTIEVAKNLGCTTDDPFAIVEFLQTYEDLEEMYKLLCFPLSLKHLATGYSLPVQPVIEKESSDALFTKTAFEYLNSAKNSIDIPIIIGINSSDGSVVLPAFIGQLDNMKNSLHYFIPDGYKNLEDSKPLEHSLKEFYFNDHDIDKSKLNELSKLLTDYLFMSNSIEFAEMYSITQHKSPLYFYVFNYLGDLNYQKKNYKLENVVDGAIHCDELGYIFPSGNPPAETWNEKDSKMVESMCKMWTNFAKHGNPTLTGEWKPVRKITENDVFNIDAYVIDDNLKMVENPYGERINFWRNLKKTAKNLFRKS